jgi:signal peptidase I
MVAHVVLAAVLAGLAGSAAGVAGLRRRVVIVTVFGPSMQPALRAGDRVLVRRTEAGGLRAGQIVVIERPGPDGRWGTIPAGQPTSGREWIIKRLAAVPGDRCPDGVARTAAGLTVPPGQFVVLGDNAANSLDSRAFGYIPAERLLGVMLRPLRGSQ